MTDIPEFLKPGGKLLCMQQRIVWDIKHVFYDKHGRLMVEMTGSSGSVSMGRTAVFNPDTMKDPVAVRVLENTVLEKDMTAAGPFRLRPRGP